MAVEPQPQRVQARVLFTEQCEAYGMRGTGASTKKIMGLSRFMQGEKPHALERCGSPEVCEYTVLFDNCASPDRSNSDSNYFTESVQVPFVPGKFAN